MMQALRDGNKPIFYLIIFFFIVGFIFLDIGGGATGCNQQAQVPNAMALVNGQPVPYQTYQQRAQVALQQAGTNGPVNERERMEIQGRAYHQLVEDLLLNQAAEERGLGTNLDEVLLLLRTNPPAEVVASPFFQTDGQFDVSKYYQALGDDRFRSNLIITYLNSLPVDKLNDELSASAKVSTAEIIETHASRKQMATISFIRVSPAAYGPPPTELAADQVATWFESRKSDYGLESAAIVSYVRLPRQPSRTDSVETREILDSIAAELDAGEPFDELLDIHSEAPVGMRGSQWLRLDRPNISFEMAEALKSLEVGETSEPFGDLFGHHLVQLDSLRVADDGTTEYRIKDILIRIEVSAETDQTTERRALGMWESLKAGAPFESVADTSGLVFQTSDPIDLTAERIFVPGLPNYREVIAFLKKGEPGSVSDVIKGAAGWFIFRLDSRGAQPAPALVDIEPQVRNDLVTDLGGDKARAAADAVASRIAAGEDLETIAAADSALTVDATRPFSRYYRIPEIGREPAVTGAAFAIDIGRTVGPIETSDGSFYFIRVDERDPDPFTLSETERTELVAALRENYIVMKRNEILASFMRKIREDAEIDDYRQVVTGTP
jgi:parvulin-like peptidyl-prolyl isomerase